MSLPFPREYEHLAPSARKSLAQITAGWRTILLQNIEQRLGKEAA
jgi:hypothetical protein